MKKNEDEQASVKRYDLRVTHSYLLNNPLVSLGLCAVCLFSALSFHFDWLGHNANNPNWQIQQDLKSAGFVFLGIFFLVYFIFALIKPKSNHRD
jgi:hypothetical protein